MKENEKLNKLYEENLKLECEFWKEFCNFKEIMINAKKELDINS